MKTSNISFMFVIFLFLMSCSGGDQMLTRINPDGSCYREFKATPDSAFMVGDTAKSNPFPVDMDSTWKVSWAYITPEVRTDWPLKSWTWDTTCWRETVLKTSGINTDTISCTNKPVTLTIRSDYKSVKEMGESFQLAKKHKWRNIRPVYELDKKFRWFYTYYTYREVYPKIKTLDRIPLEKYLSKEEAEFWFNGNQEYIKGMNGLEINDEINKVEDKYNLWFGQNILEMQYDILLENYDQIKKINISKERLILAKDSIFEKSKNKIKIMEDFDFAVSLDEYFKTNAFSEYNKTEENAFKKFDSYLEDQEFMRYFETGIDYKLLMPGKLLDYGNAVNHGDTLSWNLTAYRMVYSDYEISARSRKPNIWAFVATGIIVLLTLVSFFVKRR